MGLQPPTYQVYCQRLHGCRVYFCINLSSTLFHALGLHFRRFMRRLQNEKILATLRARRRKP